MLYNDHLSSVLQLSVSTLSQNEVFNDVTLGVTHKEPCMCMLRLS